MFCSPEGGALWLSKWRRHSNWSRLTVELGLAPVRIHDLRHTSASIWIAAGADVKVVQRILGHATASMTVDLYGHLMDRSLWDVVERLGETIGGTSGASDPAPGNGTTGEAGTAGL